MSIDFNKNVTFIMDLANNHMGSVDHGLRIIRDMRRATDGFDYNFAIKLQYRHLDTFIHPSFQNRMDIKYIKRFSETRLSPEEFLCLKSEAQELGFLTVCTPFDETSIDLIEEHDFDIIKVASCSFTDWPLLERIAQTSMPIVASTATATLEDMDRVVSFLEHRHKQFALMHCVAEYPTPDHHLALNQIELLRTRYRNLPVGYSTHESPEETAAVKIALAKGATLLEKHVGVPTSEFELNAYSATPAQIHAWVQSAAEALKMCGVRGQRSDPVASERASLLGLRRGVFSRRALMKGEIIREKDVMLAIPAMDGQISANNLSKYIEYTALTDIAANAPISLEQVASHDQREQVYAVVQTVRKMFRKAHVRVPGQVDLEISHHFGMDRFHEVGATMVTVINREYCKKLIVLLPGQRHPEQYHLGKEETFDVLYGNVVVCLDDEEQHLTAGDIVTVKRGVRHSFMSADGVIIEEVSSTHKADDSYYTDPSIPDGSLRKTLITYWLD